MILLPREYFLSHIPVLKKFRIHRSFLTIGTSFNFLPWLDLHRSPGFGFHPSFPLSTKQPLFGIFLGRRSNARNVSFRNSLQRLLHFGKFTLSTRLIKPYYLIFLSAGIADYFFSGRSMKTKEELKAAEVRFGFSQNFMIQTSCGLAAPFYGFVAVSFVLSSRKLLHKFRCQFLLFDFSY